MKKTLSLLFLLVPLFPSIGCHASSLLQNQLKQRKSDQVHFTVEQMDSKMITDLRLDDKQAKKLKKLNKKYRSLIEGSSADRSQSMSQQGYGGGMGGSGGMGGPGGGMGGPGGGMGGSGGGMGGSGGMGGPGGGMGGSGGMGGPGGNMGSSGTATQQSSEDEGMDLSGKRQDAYERKLRKILTEEQFSGYEKIKPLFESQRQIRDFLLLGNPGL